MLNPGNKESSISSCGQKLMKKKRPRGFEEETYFANVLQIDDSNIWSNLPEILLEEILARIPPFTIIRFRSVCKRWNSILQYPSVINLNSKAPSHHTPCLLTLLFKESRPQCLYVFTFATKCKITFDFLPPWKYFWLVGSSGGLVCFAGFFDETFKALVCNPLTQKWRFLPLMKNCTQRRQLIFVADGLKGSFKVIAPGDESLPTEVYDSKTNKWYLHRRMINPDIHHIMTKLDLLEVVYCGDSRLYSKSLSPSGLRLYRIDTGQWETLTSKIPASSSSSYLVSGARKRLFLVTRVLNCVTIWEFGFTQVVWVEICRMPWLHLKNLLGDVSVRSFECFGQDDFICFMSRSQGKAILFDVDKKIWSWVNGFEEALLSSTNQFFLYEPKFDASVY